MKKILLSGVFVSLGILLGRLSGFGREVFIAHKFGASEHTDLIIIFLTAPDILINLLVGGSLGLALIPELKQNTVSGAITLYRQLLTALIALFVFVVAVLNLFPEYILKLLIPGIEEGFIVNYSAYFGVSLFASVFAVAAGATTAYLHYKSQFAVPAFGTLIFNLVIIGFLFFLTKGGSANNYFLLALGICLAAFFRWLSQIVNSRVMPLTLAFKPLLLRKDLINRYFYCLLTGSFIFFVPVIIRAIASLEGPGTLSLINYALKLIEFPLGVLLTVFTVVFFPKLSQFFADKNEGEFSNTLNSVFIVICYLSVAVLVVILTNSRALVDLIFGWGALSGEQLQEITIYLILLSVTIPFQGLNSLLIAACAARKDVIVPFVVSLASVTLFYLYCSFIAERILDALYILIIMHALITFALIINLYRNHNLFFIKNKMFYIEIAKASGLGLIIFLLSSQFEYQHWATVILMCGFSFLLYLAAAFLISQQLRSFIKIQS